LMSRAVGQSEWLGRLGWLYCCTRSIHAAALICCTCPADTPSAAAAASSQVASASSSSSFSSSSSSSSSSFVASAKAPAVGRAPSGRPAPAHPSDVLDLSADSDDEGARLAPKAATFHHSRDSHGTAGEEVGEEGEDTVAPRVSAARPPAPRPPPPLAPAAAAAAAAAAATVPAAARVEPPRYQPMSADGLVPARGWDYEAVEIYEDNDFSTMWDGGGAPH
jgi:hypothetical protein